MQLSFKILENSGHTAGGDSCDSMSSSDDTYSFSSDDEAEYVKPVVPQRVRTSQNQRDVSGNNSEDKQEGKKDDSSNLDSEQASGSQFKSNSGKNDSISQKSELVSEKPESTSQKGDQSSRKAHNVEGSLENVEPGNTLNNFLEICTKRLPHDDILPEEVNDEAIVPGGFQGTNLKNSLAESAGKESSSSKGSEMGDTKYKEITEEPEEQDAKCENTACENTDCGTAGSENTAVIPGLQEIQEGLINDYDAINDQKDDIRLKQDVSVKHEQIVADNSEGSPAGNVEILATETTTSIENDTTNLPDGLVEGGGTSSNTDISPGSKNMILPQETGENPSEDLPPKETDVRTEGESEEVRQEMSSTDKEISAETENQ